MEKLNSNKKEKKQKKKKSSNNQAEQDQSKNQPHNQKIQAQIEKKQSEEHIEKQLQNESIDLLQSMKKSQIKISINQQEKSLCKVQSNKGISNGFLCRIPNPVLITSNNIFDDEEIIKDQSIIISFNDEKTFYEIIIDENRKTLNIAKTDDGDEINVSIIEIKPDEEIFLKQEFLEFDENLLKNDIENIYKLKNIYLIHYKTSQESELSIGIINNVKKNNYEIEHNADTNNYSIGCPILLYNNKVIAVQGKKNFNGKFNQGILLNFLINEYKNKLIQLTNIDPIPGAQLEAINNNMVNNLCKIHMSDEGLGSGFFCKIPFPDEYNMLNVLFTNNHVLGKNDIKNGNKIKFSLQNGKTTKEILIDDTRKIYTNEILDTTIIELKESDGINSFLNIDDLLFKSSIAEKNCEGKKIYIIQYPGGREYSFSCGKIIKIIKNQNNLQYFCSTREGSSGGAIINLSNNKVIGIHKEGTIYDYNQGTIIKAPIKEFIKKFKNDYIDIENEISIKVKIEEKDIGKKINFIGFNKALNYYKRQIKSKFLNEKETEEYRNLIEDIEKQLFELSDKNVILYINDKKDKFQTYFIPQTVGIYTITLIFKLQLKCCAGMFFECYNLTDINLSNFNSEKVTNMNSMFYCCINLATTNLSNCNAENVMNMSKMFSGCENLTSIDFTNYSTKNVTNMNKMFNWCSNLVTINLSNFNICNVTDMSKMFNHCNNLIRINLPNFNTKNVINTNEMLRDCENLTNIIISDKSSKETILKNAP